ncbi:hypothetical protein [Noviherbaspirillum suwonense]|uniref:hypothetical protein n=1 Tax=Noviherbaspirillum suwonense TaxID=1224511 RepID=UPI0024B72FB8|nr:hypothetical protein [Noviherbaspirillum suwonense]
MHPIDHAVATLPANLECTKNDCTSSLLRHRTRTDCRAAGAHQCNGDEMPGDERPGRQITPRHAQGIGRP